MQETSIDTEVLIVGAGPAGATASLALSTYGIRNICLSKYSSTAKSARAHITNQRTMEVLRHFGLERQAMAVATPQHLMGDNIYCTSLAGIELGRMRSWHTHPKFKAQHDLASPCSMVDLTQELLEPILLAGAMRGGARVRFDTEVTDFEQDATGVTAEILDRLTGTSSTLRARYMIGADGANSRVVEKLGLTLDGVTGIAASFGIGFRADLSRFVAHRPSVLYWMIQPGRGIGGYPIGALRMVRAWDRWIATWGYDVRDAAPVLSADAATEIVHRMIGDASVEVHIEGVHPWSMNRVHAKAYQRGRVFCVGDAVHRHPPMNGLGSNTSVQDSFNLAWKLALVVRGQAGEPLLDSYQLERGPVGESVVRRATDNFSVFGPVAEAVGFKPGVQTAEQFDTLATKLGESSPEGQARRSDLHRAIDRNIIGFGALGGEHNQFYRSDAVVDDFLGLSVEDPDLDVVFGLEAGRRLPHAWLTRAHNRVSSLDVCAPGRFTLLTGVSGRFWSEAAQSAARGFGVPLDVVCVGFGHRYDDPYGDFARSCMPDETGAILVRPDLFVGWHVASKPADPAHALDTALRHVLSLPAGVGCRGGDC